LGEPDLAVLRLEAARIAADGGQPGRAREELIIAERLAAGPAFRPEPVLGAQLRRSLAVVRERLGDLTQAEALLSAALPTLSVADPAAAADAANARGVLRLELVRLAPAIADFELSLTLLRQVAGNQAVLSGPAASAALVNLATARAESGDIAGAGSAAAEARLAAAQDRRLLAAADIADAAVRLREGKPAGAEGLLGGVAQRLDPADPLRGHALLALAVSRFERGWMSEAADAAAAAVESYRIALGERHPAFARAQHTLGTAQAELGDLLGAAGSLASASDVRRASFGPRSPAFQATEVERGWVDLRSGDAAAAERRARAALAAFAASAPPDSRPEGLARVLLGLVLESRGRPVEAAAAFRHAQALIERARGPFSPDLGFSLVRLGRLLTRTGRPAEALLPLDRAIDIYQRVGGAGTVRLAEAITARGELRARQGDRRGAREDAEQALALVRGRIGDLDAAESVGAEIQRRSVRALYLAQARLLLDAAPDDAVVRENAFRASQEALASRTGEAVRRAAGRLKGRGSKLAPLLQAHTDAADELRQADTNMLAWAARPGADPTGEAERRREARAAAAARLREATQAILREAPAYAEFLAPHPVALDEVQHRLGADEALLAPVASEEGMLLWVVTAEAARALPLATTRDALAQLVAKIRAGVDLDQVQGDPARLPPFDAAAARALHAALLEPAEATGLLAGRGHLILVPDGALQSLPPQLLVDAAGHWLVKTYAISIAPSVGAALATRQTAPSQAPLPFLGLGDPIFAGDMAAGWSGPRRSLGLRRQLASLERLPDTATEVQAIATLLGAQPDQVLLREKASLGRLLAAEPRRFRTLALSTHAVMAGSLQGLAEPAIILSPDAGGSGADGLLTPSEIADLDLDADLVLLSACNTAAPDGGPDAEGLSGLARAFLQAGARSLLVSHWSVPSATTMRLVTSFIAVGRTEPGLRRAEALRVVMLSIIADPEVSHPLFWAPFVVVGH
jgi:CHAT domain-containing protein